MNAIRKHTGVLLKVLPERTVANVMKLHLCHYAKNTPHAKAVRLAASRISTVSDLLFVADEFLS